ncbi:MAG: hypothetical protein IPO58_25155 [Betaproteobacteria bacterium]|nr:hypothetical protein [Betaproteobacteria bacterium]
MMHTEMNGYQLLRHRKADAELRHLPVIMISAVGEVESVVRCIELSAEELPGLVRCDAAARGVSASLEKKALRDEIAQSGTGNSKSGCRSRSRSSASWAG